MAEVPGQVSRRRVLIGTAWTAPVVLIATSVPARAGSQPDTLTMSALGANSRASNTVTNGVGLSASGDDPLTVTVRVSYPVTAVDPAAPTGVAGWALVASDPAARYWEYEATIPAAGSAILQATKTVTTADAFDVTYSVTSVTGGDPTPVSPPPNVVITVPAASTGANVGNVLFIDGIAVYNTSGMTVGFNGQVRYTPSTDWNQPAEAEVLPYSANAHWLLETFHSESASGPWVATGVYRSGDVTIPPGGTASIPDTLVTATEPGFYQLQGTLSMDDIVIGPTRYRGAPAYRTSSTVQVPQ